METLNVLRNYRRSTRVVKTVRLIDVKRKLQENPISKHGERLGFATKAFCTIKNLSAGQ